MQKSKTKTNKILGDSFQKDFEEIKKGSRSELSTTCQNYLKAIVDTRSAPKVGVPTTMGGFPGRTSIVRYTEQLEVYTGLSGFGYVSINLNGNDTSPYAGPFNDTPAIEYTISNYTGTSINQSGGGLLTGVVQSAWQQSEYSRLSLKPTDLQYRVVGCTVKIFNEASALGQNGRIVLLEPPGHIPLNSAVQATDLMIENAPTAHVIRAVQLAELREQIVLNWHPRASSDQRMGAGDFEFQSTHNGTVPTPVTLRCSDLVVMFKCASATPSQFHVEVTCMYELRGLKVTNVKPRLVDSRGIDLIQNVFASKMISGYVGKPEHVYESYMHKAWETAKKFGGFLSKHEKEISEGVGRGLKLLGGFM